MKQALPSDTFDVSYPVQSGRTTLVLAGDDLQAAIDAAAPGDTLELDAGATWKGPIHLRAKSGDGWIVLRTNVPDASFVRPGTRVAPTLAAAMPRILSNGTYAIVTDKGAHHYRLVGLEVTAAPGAYSNAMISLGVDNGATADADFPHDLVVDRCYVHADAVGGRRGVALNGKRSAVIDSYLAGFREKGADSQAIAGWDGPGPFVIVDNHLEAASENVMFGGADPRLANVVPSDIQICGNHLTKDPSWLGGGWVVKNLFELKNARRTLFAGNVLEHSWGDAQVGFSIVITPRNQDGKAPWSTVEDLTIVRNVSRHTASGINMSASDDGHPSAETARVLIADNLFDDIDGQRYRGDGRAIQFIRGGGGGRDLKLDHNTFTSATRAAVTLGDTAKYGTNFVFTNNLVARGTYGVMGTGRGEGTSTVDFYLSSYLMTKNAFFGTPTTAAYPAGNDPSASTLDVAFVDAPGGDFSLAATSKYRAAGLDGKDLGADIASVNAAVLGAAP